MDPGYTQSECCLICARRGATLCAQCKAALRRARHTPTVKTEYLPHAPVVRTEARRPVERGSSYSRAARRASRAAAPPAALGGWGTYATIISFGLAVCLTGYLAIGDNERALYPSRAIPTPVAPAEARADVAVKVRAPTPLPAAEPDSSLEVVADEHVAILESLTLTPRANPNRKPAREGRGVKDTAAAQGAREARKANPGTQRPAVAPTAIAAAPEALPEPVGPDRWQQLASAQSSCERENVIAGLVCKERARLQYCEGEWGAAPQCPVASLNTR